MLINQLDDEIIKNLSQSELYILHYVYDHPDEVIDMSIQELAKAVAFSSATILRFCKKLNFSGFAEFKFALKQQNKEIANLKKPISSMDSITSLYDDIESTSLLIKERYLKEIIDLIDSNKRIHLYGEGISRIPVDYLEKLLFSIGRQNVYKYKSSRLAAHIASNANEDDILIAISTSGNYPTTVKIVKLFPVKLYMSFWLSFYIFLNVRKALFYRLYGHFAFVVNLTYLGLSSYIFAIKRG